MGKTQLAKFPSFDTHRAGKSFSDGGGSGVVDVAECFGESLMCGCHLVLECMNSIRGCGWERVKTVMHTRRGIMKMRLSRLLQLARCINSFILLTLHLR